MTNKLRSVIEESVNETIESYWSTAFFRPDVLMNSSDGAKKVLTAQSLKLLDAIIEDMRFHRDYYDKESGMYAHGYVAALTLQINQLKQARDELSILLTQ